MRPFQVVILTPGFNELLCAIQAYENVVVQAFIPELAVKAFDIGILSRFAG